MTPCPHPQWPDGSKPIKKILSGAVNIAVGVAVLRNQGFGSGHGQVSAPSGLGVRHARLTVNAAFTWCELITDNWPTRPPRGANELPDHHPQPVRGACTSERPPSSPFRCGATAVMAVMAVSVLYSSRSAGVRCISTGMPNLPAFLMR